MTWWGSEFLRLMALRSCQLETSSILNRWFVRFAFYVTKIAIRFNNKWFCFLIHATSSTFNLLHSGEKTSLTLTKGFNSIRIWHITPRNEQTSQRSQTRYLWEWICKKRMKSCSAKLFSPRLLIWKVILVSDMSFFFRFRWCAFTVSDICYFRIKLLVDAALKVIHRQAVFSTLLKLIKIHMKYSSHFTYTSQLHHSHAHLLENWWNVSAWV